MEPPKKLLIVAHTPSPNTCTLREYLSLAHLPEAPESTVIDSKLPLETNAEDLLSCSGVLLFTTANFGYMSGMLKDFFERIYYPCENKTQGLPYCLCVRAATDETGCVASVEKITRGLRWKQAMPPLVLKGAFDEAFCAQAETFSQTFAAGLEMGIF